MSEAAVRVKKLRTLMSENGIDAYVIPTADFHQSEYVGEHFKARAFMTGFTGSYGTAAIAMDDAGLWTDGRYFLQAANQLQDSGITLFKMGEKGVPTIEEYLKENLEVHIIYQIMTCLSYRNSLRKQWRELILLR